MSHVRTVASRLCQRQQILHRIPHLTSCHTFSTLQNDVIQMQVTPRVSLFDQKVHIRVQGLPTNAKITMHLSTEQEWRRAPVLFVSCSHHVSSQTGEVDLSNNPSLGGTYTGIDPMGLFWSLHSSPGGPQNTRLVVKNVEEPLLYNLSVYKGHLTLNDLHTGGVRHQSLSSTTVTRMVKVADVRRLPVREGNIRGMLFLPPGDSPHPGVIDMFGSSGGIIETRAALLASHGFATLSLPYFRYDDLPTKLEDVDFHYFEEAAQWMNSHKSVKKGGIGVVGVSKGAEFAIMMGWKCPEVVAAVQINGPPFYGLHDLPRDGKPFLRGVPYGKGQHTFLHLFQMMMDS